MMFVANRRNSSLRQPLLRLSLIGALLSGAVSVASSSASAITRVQLLAVGKVPVIPAGTAAIGSPPRDLPIHLDVVMKSRDPAALQAFALSVSTPGSPEHGKYLTPMQFATDFAPTPHTLQFAKESLRRLGLSPGDVSTNGLVIPVNTTIGNAASALGTKFSAYRLASGRVGIANTTPPRLPSQLAELTTAVLGLDNLASPTFEPPHRSGTGATPKGEVPATTGPAACATAKSEAASTNGWTYPQLASAYEISTLFSDGIEGKGINLALFELDPWSGSDISSFQKCYGTSTGVSTKEVDGGGGRGSGEGEAALDIETAIALAPKSHLTVYDAPGTPTSSYSTSTIDEYTAIFDDDKSSIVSSSYGMCESAVNNDFPGLISSENELFQQAATEGISVLVASGDTGSEGCERNGDGSTGLDVSDPASQPFVTAVGGTDLTAVGSPPTEDVWSDAGGRGPGAGGGGISSLWPMPSWQSGPGVINAASSGTPCGASSGYCREVPDVSASASSDNPYVIYWNGSWGWEGGTSAATPLWAAMIADIESQGSEIQSGVPKSFLVLVGGLGRLLQ